MKTVQVRDKRFKMSIEYSEIHAQSLRMAKEIKKEYAKKNPLFVSVLNGAFLFAAELFKEI
ncbi:MAG: hypoxanthine phosphoribosyltransferase, partial [Bacteroidota bacterium]